jgi:hypothetical protein
LKKYINIFLLLSFQLGYLEWGKNGHLFIFQAEWEIILKSRTSWMAALHPFIIVPLSGVIMILITLFQKKPGRTLSLVGLGCMSLIMLMLLVIGFMVPNFKMILSVIPFFIAGFLLLRAHWKREVVSAI